MQDTHQDREKDKEKKILKCHYFYKKWYVV